MVHRILPKVSRDLLKVLILGLSVAILFGCAKALVVPIQVPGEGLPKPDHIAVYDFAVTPDDVQLDRGAGPEMIRNVKGKSQTTEEVRVGRVVAEALSEKLVYELRSNGITAYRAQHAPPPTSVSVSITGQFKNVDEGNRTLRTVVGFGLGGSRLGTSLQVYQGTGTNLKLVGQAETMTESSMKPGIGALLPVGAAVGTVATAAAVSGTTTVASEKFFATVEEDASRTAKEIAKRIIKYYTRHGWLPR